MWPEGLFFDYDIDRNYLPENFLQDDVTVAVRRSIFHASQAMLSLLGKAKTWLVNIPQTVRLLQTTSRRYSW